MHIRYCLLSEFELSSFIVAKTLLSSLQGFKLAKKKNFGLSDNNLTAFLLR
jgi:hypothetical protein